MKSYPSIPLPAGRLMLVVLAVAPAAMGYPWQSVRERWALGIAVTVAVLLLARWRALFVTTILRRRVAMMRRNRGGRAGRESGIDVRTTALLRVTPPDTAPDLLPLPLIARYLNRYGLHGYALRVTSRDAGAETGAVRQTWIGLTVSAVDNLAALRARAPQIPLHETAQVAVRRLGDHLREHGWAAAVVAPDDLPRMRPARETWRGTHAESGDYVAAYRVKVDGALPETLAAIDSYPARERWIALEIADDGTGRTAAVGCALRTDGVPQGGGTGPLAGLDPQAGNHGPALTALHPLCTERLDGHVPLPADLLGRLRWRSVEQSTSRHTRV